MSDMLLKAVFWDLDGTLIDSEPYWHEGEMEIAAAHGGYWDEDLAWSCSGTPLDHCAKTMIEHGTNLPPEQIAKAMVDYVAKKEFERVPWTNGVLDVLGSLVDAGIPSVLVTTSPRRLAQNVIDHAPAGAFAGFVCGDDDLPHKPDPAPYLAAAKMLGMVLHGMQGTPYIYQGEELGMTNPHFSRITDYRDVESLNMFAELRASGREPDELLAILASKSRDNGRTPMQWDASHNAGFTEGEPWIGVCDNYETVNARAALDDADSVFYTYQSLIRLRKTLPVLTWGDYEDLLPEHPSLWCYRRQWQGQTLMVVANLSHLPQEWQADALSGESQVVISNYPAPQTSMLRPFEAVWWLKQ